MRLLSDNEVAAMLGINPQALRKQRCLGVKPGEMPLLPWRKLGSRVRYDEADVLAYIEALPKHGTEGAAV